MASWYDIDTPIRVNGDLTVTGTTIDAVNGLIKTTGTISGGSLNIAGTITSSAINSSGTISGNAFAGNGVGLAGVLLTDGSRAVTGNLTVNGTITSSSIVYYGISSSKGALSYASGGGLITLEAQSTNTNIDIKPTGTGNAKINGNLIYHAGNLSPVSTSRLISSGTGLLGGGNLASDRTLSVDFGTGVNQSARGNHNHDTVYVKQDGTTTMTGTLSTTELKIGGLYVTKYIGNFSTTKDVANQKVDIYLPVSGGVSGYMDITVVGTWSYGNADGNVTKRYSLNLGNSGTISHQSTKYIEAFGGTPSMVGISDFAWDSGNSRWRVQVAQIPNTGVSNNYRIFVNAVLDGSYPVATVENIAIGSVYTTDATVFSNPIMQLQGGTTVLGTLTLNSQATVTTQAVRADRLISAGTGLLGGGDLTADRAISVNLGGNGIATTISRSDHNHDTTYLKLDGTNTITGQLVIDKTSSHIQLKESGVSKWHFESVSGQLRFVETGISQRLILDTGNTGQMTWNGYTIYNSGNLSPVTTSRLISTGTGLLGGGDLTTDRTISVDFGTSGNQVASGNHLHDDRYQPIQSTTFNDMGASISVRTATRGTNEYYEFWDSSAGWAPIKSGSLITNGFISGSSTLTVDGTSILTGLVTLGAQATATNHAVRADRLISSGSGLLGGGNLTADRTISVNFGTGNTQVAAGNHNHNSLYASTTHTHVGTDITSAVKQSNYLAFKDTRGVNNTPADFNGNYSGSALSGDFKQRTVVGVPGSGTYVGVITVSPWTDDSGGPKHQLSFGSDGDIYHRWGSTGNGFGTWSKLWKDANLSPVKSDVAGQSVNGNFSIFGDGNLWVGTAANDGQDGDITVRDTAGNNKIQIAGGSATQLSGVNSYIAGNGNANFAGTITVNTLVVNTLGLVSNLNSEMLNGLKEPEFAKVASIVEIGGYGVSGGLSVQAQAVPNMSVLINSGTVYTNTGKRYSIAQTTQALSASSSTYDRYDVIYIQGSSAGANEGKIGYIAGTPAASPVDPTVPADAVKLSRVLVRQNIGSIQNADITDISLRKPVTLASDNSLLLLQLQTNSIISNGGTSISVNKPFKGTGWAKSITIPAGQTSATWTHNLALGTSYVVTWSTNSPNRHIYWTNKATNSIVFNLDDVADVDIVIDVVIMAY